MGVQELYKGVKESAAGFVIDKVVSIGAGLAASLIGSIFFPIMDIVFQLYTPFTSFLEAYVYYCIATFVVSILVWITVWRRPLLRSVVPYVISLVAIIISGLMRSGIYLPNIVGLQFILFFGGILMLCEALIIHVLLLAHDLLRRLGLIGA